MSPRLGCWGAVAVGSGLVLTRTEGALRDSLGLGGATRSCRGRSWLGPLGYVRGPVVVDVAVQNIERAQIRVQAGVLDRQNVGVLA